MTKLNVNTMREVVGGAHCRYCCQDMNLISYLVHGLFSSYHILQKKLGKKCKHK